jgi:hypothetical protein
MDDNLYVEVCQLEGQPLALEMMMRFYAGQSDRTIEINTSQAQLIAQINKYRYKLARQIQNYRSASICAARIVGMTEQIVRLQTARFEEVGFDGARLVEITGGSLTVAVLCQGDRLCIWVQPTTS